MMDIDQYAWLFSLPLVATAAVGCVWIRRRGCAPSSRPCRARPILYPTHHTESPRLGNVLCRVSTCPVVCLTTYVSWSGGLPHRAVSLGLYPWILLRLCVLWVAKAEENLMQLNLARPLYMCRRTSNATTFSVQEQPLHADSPNGKNKQDWQCNVQ